MKLRIWHFVTPTPTAWQQDKPADDNGTAEHFLDGCVAAHRTANNGWQTSPTRTPQRIWFLENVAGGPPEDVDGAWVRCYFDPQSGRWVALGNPAAPPEGDVETPIKFTATAPASFCRPHQVGRVWGFRNNSTFSDDGLEESRQVFPGIGTNNLFNGRTMHQRRYPAAFTCESEETIGATELRVAIDGNILSQVHILNPSHQFADLARIGFGDEFFPILLSCSYGRYRLRQRIEQLDTSHPLGPIELWSISDEVRPSDLTFRFGSGPNSLIELGPDREGDPDEVFLLGSQDGSLEISVSYHSNFENDTDLPNQPDAQVHWDLNVQFSQRLIATIPLSSPVSIASPEPNFDFYVVERERIRILVNGSPLTGSSGLPLFEDGTFDSHRSTRLLTGSSQANRAFFSFNRKFFTEVGDVITIERNGVVADVSPDISEDDIVSLSGTATVVRRFGPHGMAGGANSINGVLPQEYLDTFVPYADADWHWGETEDRDDCPEVLYVDTDDDPQNWDLNAGATIDRAATIEPLPPQLNVDDFEYSIDMGTLPPGLMIEEDDGTISGEVTGTSGASGSFIIAARTRSYYLVTDEIEWTIN